MIDDDIVFLFNAGLILTQYYFLLKGKGRTGNSKNSRALNESLSVKPAVTMLTTTPLPTPPPPLSTLQLVSFSFLAFRELVKYCIPISLSCSVLYTFSLGHYFSHFQVA